MLFHIRIFVERPTEPPYAPYDGYAFTPLPIDDESYLDVYNISLNCTVSDLDGDYMDIRCPEYSAKEIIKQMRVLDGAR